MWRRNLTANARTLSDVEVFQQDLPRSGILNGFLLRVSATNGGTSNIDNPLRANINSVQIRDGGRTLLDLTGPQAELVSLLASWRPPGSIITEVASGTQTFDVFVPLGLRPFDDSVGLDLSLLNNPVLRVDLDLTAVRAVGATGFLTGSATISLITLINDGGDAPSPSTFLKSAELKRWTTAASGDELSTAPVDAPWSRLLVRAALAGSLPSDILTDIKLDFDSGQLVVLDEPTVLAGVFMSTLQKVYGPFNADILRANAATYDTGHAQLRNATVTSEGITSASRTSGFADGELTVDADIDNGTTGIREADTTARVRHVQFWARQPYQSLIYDFGEMGLLDPTGFDRAQITLTQGVASAAASIVLQQLAANTASPGRTSLSR